MRTLIFLLLCATPGFAWEFSASPVCTISHSTSEADVVVTYDPRQRQPYAISMTLKQGTWPQTSPFSIQFIGDRTFAIGTDRHLISEGDRRLTVSDTGFGNVLNGLQNSMSAVAALGTQSVTVPLTHAAEAVKKFRDCSVVGMS